MALSFTTPSYSPARTHWQNSFYYLDISDAPVHPNSTSALNTTKVYHQSYGRNWIQFNAYTSANWNQTIFDFFPPHPFGSYSEFQASYFVDTYPYPGTYNTQPWNLSAGGALSNGSAHGWFPDLRAENARGNGSGGFFLNYVGGDRHTIMWAEQDNKLVESTGYTVSSNTPYAENVVTYDLSSYILPVNGSNACGVVAARIPLAPLLFNYNDLVACGSTGDLGHMVGWVARDYANTHQWPARNGDGLQTNGGLWAGSVIRLRPDFPLNSLPNDPMRAFARTLQKYGAILYDKNFNNAVFGVPSDSNWPTNFGAGVQSFTYDDFQVVDMSEYQVASNSIEVISPPGPPSYSFGALDQLAARFTELEALFATDPNVLNFRWNINPTGTIDPLYVVYYHSPTVAYPGPSTPGSWTWSWDFGDGSTFSSSTTGVTSRTYSAPGTYTVTLTVDDGSTQTSTQKTLRLSG